jgi:DNA polymerase elongation subunit (family B)
MKKPKDFKFCVIDAETDPFLYGRIPQPFAWGYYDGEKYVDFWGEKSTDDVWKFLQSANVPIVYAHNGGKFDFHYLLKNYSVKSDEIFCIHSRIAKWKTKHFQFRDSWLILPVALSALEKDEVDYNTFESEEREKPENKDKIRKYLKSDCIYLYNYIKKFVELYGDGLTIAGRAFSELAKRDIKPIHTWIDYDRTFREFYFGGRCEFYELGAIKRPTTVIDINSAYPNAMLKKHWWGKDYDTLKRLPTDPERLDRCMVRFKGTNKGALPMRVDDTLRFDVEKGEFCVTGWELRAALEYGLVNIEKIIAVHEPREVRGFSEYVNYFYEQRLLYKKDQPENKLAKLMMNAPYGRFALDPTRFKDVCVTEFRKPVLKKNGKIDRSWSYAGDFDDANLTLWERPVEVNEQTKFYNVATACSITGAVRAQMLRALHTVEKPLYCDTDSIFCASTGNLVLGMKLGEWKVETVLSELHIAGKKLYAGLDAKTGEWKTASKGVKLKPAELIALAQGDEQTYEFAAPNFSLFASSKTRFVKRLLKRADKRNLIENEI